MQYTALKQALSIETTHWRIIMNTFKTLLTTAAITTSFSISSVSANGFFTIGTEETHQGQPASFNSEVHKGTTFWDYYYSGHSTATVNKNDQIASVDESITRNPYLAPLYN